MTIAAIQVENITKRFGDVTALDGLSFSVQPGELFFLLGPSGCGKTTMLRILAGLEAPDSGTIRFGGEDVATRSPYQRGAPMVFQNYALWPHLNVRDNVGFGLVERRMGRRDIHARVEDVLERVGLAGYGKRLPGQLSGGQQQRVVLARALVVNPSIVLLDEPLSNLDAKLRSDMREEIGRLHRETDIAFVYVTHDQVESLSLADRMAVMSAGRIVGVGNPSELYHRPPNRFCADFLGKANLVAATVDAVRQDDVSITTPFGAWHARCADPSTLKTGQSVQCMLRPENITPGKGGDGANHFEALVESIQLTGATLEVSLHCRDHSYHATVLSRYALPLVVGQTGPWHIAIDDTVVISDVEDASRHE
ncbi:MAG: ABC transporter ATP-binding protein [Lentisphaerae bacterium]|nr:ABC transporter ATP-binding protein [Lentisphaerota bacterium]